MKYLLLILLLVSSSSIAKVEEFNITGFSYHLFYDGRVFDDNSFEAYNEVNPGIGITIDDYNISLFHNSYNNPSLSVSKNYETYLYPWFSINTRIGLMTGYEYFVVPAISFGATTWYENHGIELGFIQFTALSIQYRYKF